MNTNKGFIPIIAIIVAIIIIAGGIVGGWVYVKNKSKPSPVTPANSLTPRQTSISTSTGENISPTSTLDEIANWETYIYDIGLKFKYPKELELEVKVSQNTVWFKFWSTGAGVFPKGDVGTFTVWYFNKIPNNLSLIDYVKTIPSPIGDKPEAKEITIGKVTYVEPLHNIFNAACYFKMKNNRDVYVFCLGQDTPITGKYNIRDLILSTVEWID